MDALSVHDGSVGELHAHNGELLHQGQVWEASSLLGARCRQRAGRSHRRQKPGRAPASDSPRRTSPPRRPCSPSPRVYVPVSHAVGIRLVSGHAPFVFDSGAPHPKHLSGGDEHRVYQPRPSGLGALTVETHLPDSDADLTATHSKSLFVERLRGDESPLPAPTPSSPRSKRTPMRHWEILETATGE